MSLTLPQLEFPSHPTCVLCPLHTSAKSVGVPTIHLEGSLLPDPSSTTAVVFLGMNPGVEEDESGLPFVGQSGKRLKQGYIDGLSLRSRCSVYLTNTVRCGPSPKFPKACSPTCFPYTIADLQTILLTNKRTAVVACGAIATEALFAWLLPPIPVKRKGKIVYVPPHITQSEAFHRNGESYLVFFKQMGVGSCNDGICNTSNTSISLTHFSTYHPAALGYNPRLEKTVVDHLELLNKWVDGTILVPPVPSLIPVTNPPENTL